MDLVATRRDAAEAEWRVFVAERAGWARGLARGLLGNAGDVDDAVQEAWSALHRALPQWRCEAPFAAWARTVVRHALVDQARRRGRSRVGRVEDLEGVDLASLRDNPLRELSRSERIERVRRALAGLAVKDREVLVLHRFEGCSYAEIAAQLGVPPGTVKSRMAAAMVRLTVALRGLGEEEER